MHTKKPIVLVLASTFPRWKDDTEPRFVYDLCQELKQQFKILVLSPHCCGSKTHEILEGLNVFRYRYVPEKLEVLAYEGGITSKLKNKFNWLILPFFFIGQWFAILKLLRQFPVEVIHAHWLIPQGILALAARLVSYKKPAIICTSHGGDLYGLNDPVNKAIKRIVIKNVDLITVVSTAMQDQINKLVSQSTMPIVAPMGTDLQKLFTPDKSVKRNLDQLLFVGRLVEKKGLRYLLYALPEIIKIYSQLTLNIAGTGPEQQALEALVDKLNIKNHVKFLGRLSHKQLVTQYRQATIAVFPFIEAKNGDAEGLGLVMIEALGCICPVIASDIPAAHDVITDRETGLLVKTASPHQLAKQIIFLLKSPELRESLAKTGHLFVKDNFDWDNTYKQYQVLLEQVISVSKEGTMHKF